MSSDEHIDASSLERIVPDQLQSSEATGSETLQLHLERYAFATDNLIPGQVLDIACGVGYGTAMLATSKMIAHAIGVDISVAAVRFASQRYGNEKISFQCSDALTFSSDNCFENIVSLETIEHVDHPRIFFAHLASMLAPGGRLVASVPVTPSVDANPHHKSNFSVKSFREMGDAASLLFLKSLDQVQPYNAIAIARRQEARSANLRRNLASFYFRNPSHLLLRLWSTLRDGFANKYLTAVWEKPR